jgi:hypothetical protein
MAADLEAVRVAVQETVQSRGKKWKDTTWSNFIKDVVSLLLREGRDQDDTVAAAVGLILYGVTNEKELQAVADNKAEFKRQLAEEGVHKAISDLLFDNYVGGATAEFASVAVEIGAAPGGLRALVIGAVEATHTAIRTRDQTSLLRACQALKDVAAADAENHNEIFMDEGAHVALVAATREAIRAQHADALRFACAALERLTRYTETIERIPALFLAEAGEALVAATREAIRAQHAGTLCIACETLERLARYSPERAQALVQAGAGEALVAATREAVRAQHVDALSFACEALVSLASDSPERAQALVQAGAGEALVAATREAIRALQPLPEYTEFDDRALRHACKALGNLAEDSPERAQALVQAGAVEALVAATREAMCVKRKPVEKWKIGYSNPPMSGDSCYALLVLVLSESHAVRAALEAADAPDVLFAAFRAGNPGGFACKALEHLAASSPEIAARVRREGLADRIRLPSTPSTPRKARQPGCLVG